MLVVHLSLLIKDTYVWYAKLTTRQLCVVRVRLCHIIILLPYHRHQRLK